MVGMAARERRKEKAEDPFSRWRSRPRGQGTRQGQVVAMWPWPQAWRGPWMCLPELDWGRFVVWLPVRPGGQTQQGTHWRSAPWLTFC